MVYGCLNAITIDALLLVVKGYTKKRTADPIGFQIVAVGATSVIFIAIKRKRITQLSPSISAGIIGITCAMMNRNAGVRRVHTDGGPILRGIIEQRKLLDTPPSARRLRHSDPVLIETRSHWQREEIYIGCTKALWPWVTHGYFLYW